nr:PREDICTED: phosphatidylinositol 3,4,5-trisphosphate 5-phosphatase 1 [Latimeria chalumnae]|eukprot:XP_006003065.1 PREDICTED: phosphatidylinositol 3,4,5-trisphosphate 5-phosphatase 1 [Latimeria chalumnae]
MNYNWYHGNITRSKAEDLLAKAAKDGSYLVRDSESIPNAYALCVLFQNCVYTYRILPNEDDKLTVQASEGVAVRYFLNLPDLIEFYMNENMGLVTHLQYSVYKEEEAAEEPEEEADPGSVPPELPPRNFSIGDGGDMAADTGRTLEVGKTLISESLVQALQLLDTSSIPEDHLKAIQEYLRVHITSDAEAVQNGSDTLPQLKKLLKTLCKGLHNEVIRTLPALESIQTVLDQQLSPGGRLRAQLSAEGSPGTLISKLNEVTSLLSSIEDKVWRVVAEDSDGGHRCSLIPPVTFEVKAESIGISQKLHLKVDVESGKVVVKKSRDGPEDKVYNHKKILQLIKSQKFPKKLVIVVETEKEKTQRKEYVFSDSKKREGFCQLLQQMKNKHSEQPEPDMITIFIGSWNMGDAPPPSITSWFLSKGQGKTRDDTADYIPHDIYVIGTQEDPLGDKEWLDILRRSLQQITNINFKLVSTRVPGACNKGAVGVSFLFNGTCLGFVNSHLTSGSEKKLRRNQNYINILRFLTLGDKKLNPFDITHRFTHLFWLGDLNYRVELPVTDAENMIQKIKQQQYQDLLSKDQLTMERKENKIFLNFEEEEITFAPTYRYERNTREKYAYIKPKATGPKYNLPSWCDRVLWKSYPMVHVVCQSYGCTNDIMTSDHSPVFATFEVGVTSQFVSKNDPNNSDSHGKIEIFNCSASLRTKSKTKFFIEFHSSCLENFVKSQEGENFDESDGVLFVKFPGAVQLIPIISDQEYLLDQHILISVKSADSDESYGEGCIALRSESGAPIVPCYTFLTHHGETAGDFRGEVKLQASEGKQREKLYDFVKVERDDPNKQMKMSNSNEVMKLCDQSFRKAKNPNLMAEKAAAIARGRVTSPCTVETQSKDDNPRLPQFTSSIPTDISNPNYMGVGNVCNPLAVCGQQKAATPPDQPPNIWNYDLPPKQSSPVQGWADSPLTPPSRSPLSPKKFQQPLTNRGPSPWPQEPQLSETTWGKSSHDFSQLQVGSEDMKHTEMFENPLYGSMSTKPKSGSKKDQDSPRATRKELPALPDTSTTHGQPGFPKSADIAGKQTALPVPVPVPRNRSNTYCSTDSKNQQNDRAAAKQGQAFHGLGKKPVVPSRSEAGMKSIQGQVNRPPLPAKSRAVMGLQQSKGRDYRETSELPPNQGKLRGDESPVTRAALQ